MTAIVCISDGGGMIFNKRRQSRDRVVVENVASLVAGGTLFITKFSSALFYESALSVIAVSDPMLSANSEDFVFIEDRGLSKYKEKIEKLVIYKWNRKYPSDLKLDINPEKEGMVLDEVVEFAGHSHEKITREIWKRG